VNAALGFARSICQNADINGIDPEDAISAWVDISYSASG
jgi:hypothetical protein